jgi:hypothetical protein
LDRPRRGIAAKQLDPAEIGRPAEHFRNPADTQEIGF